MRVQGLQFLVMKYDSLTSYKRCAFYPDEVRFVLEHIAVFPYKTIILQSTHPATNTNTLKKNACVLLKNFFPHDASRVKKTAENSVKLALRVVINYLWCSWPQKLFDQLSILLVPDTCG